MIKVGLSFMFGAGVGFVVGVILTCFVLAKRNLAKMEKMSDDVETKVKDSMAMAKATYDFYKKSPAERQAFLEETSEESETLGESETQDESKNE